MKVRLRAIDGRETLVYGRPEAGNPMFPLHETRGVLFPYTPQINISHQANWEPVQLVHANQEYYHYRNTSSPRLGVTGTFTASNNEEAIYLLAVLFFFRTATKMYFGIGDLGDPAGVESARSNRGMPPEVLILEGYGRLMIDSIPVLLTSATWSLPSDVDYVRASVPGRAEFDSWVPMRIEVSIDLIVQNSPALWADRFDLGRYRNGDLLREMRGWF